MVWGFGFVVVKNSLDMVSPIEMLAFRFSIAALVLGAIFFRKLKQLSRKVVLEGMVIGFLIFFGYLMQTVGIKYTTASKNAFLTTAYVVLVPFVQWLINHKKPNRYCIIGAFVAVVGIGLLSLQGDLSMNLGDLLSVICGVGFALHMVYTDRFTEHHDPIVLAVLQMIFAALFSLIAVLVSDDGGSKILFTTDVVISMLYLGALATAVGFLLQTMGQRYASPTTASLLLSLESVFGVVFSIVFLQERLTGKMIAGCVLIFIGIMTSETQFDFLPWKKE